MSRLRKLRLWALIGMLLSFIGLTALVSGGRYAMAAVYLLALPGLAGCALMAATGLYELIRWLRARRAGMCRKGNF